MSDGTLYPEDILSQRLSLTELAHEAAAAADEVKKAEAERNDAIEVELMHDIIFEFVTERLGLPEHVLEDTAFTVDHTQYGRARVNWEMDGLRFRAHRTSTSSDTLHPVFEVMAGRAQFGSAWKTFDSLAALGRLI
jgi:hypothetical protein